MRDLLSLAEIPKEEVESILDLAARLKAGEPGPSLAGRTAVLVFLNPSLRTRTSFEIAMARLGGHAVVLSPGSDAWRLEAEDGAVMDGAAAEHVREAAGVLGVLADLVGVRAFPSLRSFARDARETVLRGFARHAGVPVVNLESALSHPLQALADLLTLRETLGDLPGRRLLLTWAYHPRPLPLAVPRSILLAARRFGLEVTLARPAGFELPPELEAGVEVVEEPDAGFPGAEAVYAKSWASPAHYGRFEEEAPLRAAARGWRVTEERMARTADGAPFLHCLPVRRNVVVDDAVLDGPRSAVLREAKNRLWTTMAAVSHLIGG